MVMLICCSVAIVDLWSSKSPPSPEALNIKAGATDIIVKVSVSVGSEGEDSSLSIEDVKAHIKTFKPDVSILVLRHPAVNLAALNSKVVSLIFYFWFYKPSSMAMYLHIFFILNVFMCQTVRDFGGSMESKAQLLELAFTESFLRTSESLFDEVVLYEDLCTGEDSLAIVDTTTGRDTSTAIKGGRNLLSTLEYDMQSKSASQPTAVSYSHMTHRSIRRLFSRMGITSVEEQDNMLKFDRSIEQVNDYAAAQCGWCGANQKKSWGMKPVNYAKFDNLKSTLKFAPPVQKQAHDPR